MSDKTVNQLTELGPENAEHDLHDQQRHSDRDDSRSYLTLLSTS
jgi:hypothetical protein